MNRGSEGAQIPDDSQGRAFNEAPIHESGKWASAQAR